jgi:hypothetical protein
MAVRTYVRTAKIPVPTKKNKNNHYNVKSEHQNSKNKFNHKSYTKPTLPMHLTPLRHKTEPEGSLL